MNRRQFLKELSKAAVLSSISTALFSCSKKDKNKEFGGLDDFIRELSKFDILHFGEVHPVKNSIETTTLEDFVDFFLPMLRAKKLVVEPYKFIRTEHLPSEIDQNGNTYISEKELDNFDKSGIISLIETPVLFKELLSGLHKDPYGAIKIAREGTKIGYRVRGAMPPVSYLIFLEKVGMEKGKEFEKKKQDSIINIMRSIAVRDSYLQGVRADMEKTKRLIIYGGALHNDNNDVFESGIADEMKKEFPGRYAAIDLIKPAVVDTNEVYYQDYYSILKNKSINTSSLNEMIIVKTQGDEKADYVVFLPKRIK